MIYLGPPVSKDASLEDLVPLLKKLCEIVENPRGEISTCKSCGCLKLPTDPTCPGCKAAVMMQLDVL